MPWRESSLMDQRLQFIAEYILEVFSMTELCARYGISRKTGYKWIARYETGGPAGLLDRSRRPPRRHLTQGLMGSLLRLRLERGPKLCRPFTTQATSSSGASEPTAAWSGTLGPSSSARC